MARLKVTAAVQRGCKTGGKSLPKLNKDKKRKSASALAAAAGGEANGSTCK
jgi:hypothetical protein